MRTNGLYALAAVLSVAMACSKAYDDSALQERLDKVEADVENVASMLDGYKSQLDKYQTFISAYESGAYVSSYEEIKDGEAVVGYRITFDGSILQPIEIMKGADGKPGTAGDDGYSPVLGVVKDADGIYWWTVDGEKSDMGASSDIRKLGIVNGETPQIYIEEGKWYAKTGDAEPVCLGEVSATDAIVGDDIFGDVEDAESVLKITLWNGTEVELPKVQEYGVFVEGTTDAKVYAFRISGEFDAPALSVICPYGGWKALVEAAENGLTGLVTLTPPATVSAGSYVFNVLVTDGVHSASTAFTVTVNEEGGLE